jgi:hypothetical protein
MKLVREHINEKFIVDSDPIADMGIGTMSIIKKFCESKKDDVLFGKNTSISVDVMLLVCVENKKYDYVKYLLDYGANVNSGSPAFKTNEDLPVRYALFNNDFRMTTLLLNYGASIRNAFSYSNSPKEIFASISKKLSKSIQNLIIQAFE